MLQIQFDNIAHNFVYLMVQDWFKCLGLLYNTYNFDQIFVQFAGFSSFWYLTTVRLYILYNLSFNFVQLLNNFLQIVQVVRIVQPFVQY